jgi:hypothetical protein
MALPRAWSRCTRSGIPSGTPQNPVADGIRSFHTCIAGEPVRRFLDTGDDVLTLSCARRSRLTASSKQPYSRSSVISSAIRSWSVISRPRSVMVIFMNSTARCTQARLMFFLAASRVSLSAPQENVKEKMMYDGCGEKCEECTTKCALLGSLARMLAESRAGTSSQQSVMTWKSMVTKSGRVLYRLRLSGLNIDVDGVGSSFCQPHQDAAKSNPPIPENNEPCLMR